ncbi:MAG: isopeptide-forming domain-containing fimbrial protein, partial [Bacteroidota bacterium]
VVQDVLPATLVNCALLSATQGNGSTPVSTTGDLFGAGLSISEINATDGNDNTGNDMVLLRYQCECSTMVQPRQEIINTASVSWASRPDALRFPAVTAEAKVTIANPEIFKFVEKISPRYAGDDTRVQIGDTVFYVINLIVPEGTNADLNIVDRVDDGLEILRVDEVIAPTGVTTDLSGGFEEVQMTEPTDGQNITLDFGTITNANNDNAVEDFITIKYTALVRNTPFNGENIDANTGVGRALRNEAKLFYDGNQTNNVTTTVRIVESLVAVEKRYIATDNPNAEIDEDGNIAGAAAGDVVDYQVIIRNTGAGAMVDARLFDIDTQLDDCTVSSVVDQDGNILTFTTSNDTIVFDTPISPQSTVSITYENCTIAQDVQPGEQIDNEVTVFFDPQAGETGFSTMSDNAVIGIKEPSITVEKIDITPGYSGDLEGAQIGEIVTYRATIEIPTGTSENALFTDIVDEGLAFVDVVAVMASTGMTTTAASNFSSLAADAVIAPSGNGSLAPDRQLQIDFGTVVNADADNSTTETIVIEYRAMVLNTSANVRDQMLNSNVSWSWNTDENPPTTIVDTTTITVVEPEVTITTTFSDPSIDLEDETFVILTIEHTDDSNGTAKDIVVSNELPFGMLFIDGSFNTNCPTTPMFE